MKTFAFYPYFLFLFLKGGAVAEWSKALLVRENKREKKDPRFVPRPGHLIKISLLSYPLSSDWSFSCAYPCRLTSLLEHFSQVGLTADHNLLLIIQLGEGLSTMRVELAGVWVEFKLRSCHSTN